MSTSQALSAFSENATRLTQRLQDLGRDLEFGTSTAALFDGPDDKIGDIRKMLDSNSDREKIDALRRLIAMISKNRPVPEFFAQVVKNVASHNLQVRKLVYIYILRYAESEPDLALLSINTFQKDLTDSSPLIRAMALRVLSGIRVNMIGGIVAMGIKKCAADVSPYVRKTAALAIPKCLSLDASLTSELLGILKQLLNERSPLAIGAVLVAFQGLCPERLDLIHVHYRRLCHLVADADEWGQITILGVLLRYARRMLTRPVQREQEEGLVEIVDSDLQLLLSSAEPLFMSRNPAVVLSVARVLYYLTPPSSPSKSKIVGPLLRLLHTSEEIERTIVEDIYLIARDNPDLLLSHHYRFYLQSIDRDSTKLAKLRILVRILRSANANALLGEFQHYAHDASDEVAAAAIRAIGTCARTLAEYTSRCISILIVLMKDPCDAVGSTAVRVLKDLVQLSASRHLTDPNATRMATDSVAAVQSPIEIVASLAQQLDSVKHPRAKACIFWLVGQYASITDETTSGGRGAENKIPGMATWAPDVLRRAVKSFAQDPKLVKLQTLTLTSKLLLLAPENPIIAKMAVYCFNLARFDIDYDVRDRARLLGTLLSDISPLLKESLSAVTISGDNEAGDEGTRRGVVTLRKQQIQMILLQGKEPAEEEADPIDPSMTLGSMALLTGKLMGETWRLSDWEEQGTENSLRDSAEDRPAAPLAAYATPKETRMQGFGNTSNSIAGLAATNVAAAGAGVAAGAKWKDIDAFYADDDEGKEEEEEEEDEEEEESEEEDYGKEKVEEEEEEEEESEEEEETDESEEADEHTHVLRAT